MASLQKSPEQRDKEFEHIKKQIKKYVADGFSGTIVDWMEKLKRIEYADELNVGSALAELAYERKVSLLSIKKIQDGSEAGTGLILMGIYGTPNVDSKK